MKETNEEKDSETKGIKRKQFKSQDSLVKQLKLGRICVCKCTCGAKCEDEGGVGGTVHSKYKCSQHE